MVVVGDFVAPQLLTPALLIAFAVGVFSLIAFCMTLFHMAQYFLLRSSYFAHLPSGTRDQVRTRELRARGAPGWYIRMGRPGRMSYVVGVLIVAAAAVLLPMSIALRVGLFIALALVFIGIRFLAQ